jgi:hypothetical protein
MSTPPKKANRFIQFREIIESSDNSELMESCLSLLRIMIEISDMKEKISEKEKKMEEDAKMSFFKFFLEGLPDAEVSQLADKCSGRLKILQKRDEKEKAEKEKAEKELQEASAQTGEQKTEETATPSV